MKCVYREFDQETITLILKSICIVSPNMIYLPTNPYHTPELFILWNYMPWVYYVSNDILLP